MISALRHARNVNPKLSTKHMSSVPEPSNTSAMPSAMSIGAAAVTATAAASYYQMQTKQSTSSEEQVDDRNSVRNPRSAPNRSTDCANH